ncbi:MAG TPA: hypothetical protein VES02_09575 [Dermatophilaceae bacterium]|nr:hypothetical protein [Dermatophilaceae bacterium]
MTSSEQGRTGSQVPTSLTASSARQRRHAEMLAEAGVRGERKFNRYLSEKWAAEARYRESLLRW